MSIETLLLLKQCLMSQNLPVSDESFKDVATAVIKALGELDDAIKEHETKK